MTCGVISLSLFYGLMAPNASKLFAMVEKTGDQQRIAIAGPGPRISEQVRNNSRGGDGTFLSRREAPNEGWGLRNVSRYGRMLYSL